MVDDFSIASMLMKEDDDWEELSESEESEQTLEENDLWSIPGLVHMDKTWIAMESSDMDSDSNLIDIPLLQDPRLSEPVLAKSYTCTFNTNSTSTLAQACRPFELEEVEKVRSGPVKLPETSSSMTRESAFQQLYISQLQRLSDCMLRSQISRMQIMQIEACNIKKKL